MFYVVDIPQVDEGTEFRVKLADTSGAEGKEMTLSELNSDVHKNEPILGVFRNTDRSVSFVRAINTSGSNKVLTPIIDKIMTPELKIFATLLSAYIPEYFFHVAASSTGKYHPVGDLGEGGLVRHTESVCEMLINLTAPESVKNMLAQGTEKPVQYIIDCMYVACLFHDSLKSGWQDDYEQNKHTKHEHPLYAAGMVSGMRNFLPDETLDFIAGCIASHMGEWNKNKYSTYVLPKPSTIYQTFVHMADYIASRENIVMEHDVKGVKTYYVPDDRVMIPTNRYGDNKANMTI